MLPKFNSNDPEPVEGEIKRKTRYKFTTDEKTMIVLEGLRAKAVVPRFIIVKSDA